MSKFDQNAWGCLKMIGVLPLLIILNESPSATGQGACLETRAALDVGSSGTKIKVARVNVCTQSVEQILFDGSRAVVAVDYGSDLTRQRARGRQGFSSSIRREGLQSVRTLLRRIRRFRVPVRQIEAIATQAFREANNAGAFVREIRRETGVRIRVVTQREEARLGYFAAASAMGAQQNLLPEMVTWDLGSRSHQMIAIRGGRYYTNRGATGAWDFAEQLRSEVSPLADMMFYPLDQNPIFTPNDLLERARSVARSEVDHSFRQFLGSRGAVIVGLGAVFKYCLRDLLRLENLDSTELNSIVRLYRHDTTADAYREVMGSRASLGHDPGTTIVSIVQMRRIYRRMTSLSAEQMQAILPPSSRPYYRLNLLQIAILLGMMEEYGVTSLVRTAVTNLDSLLVQPPTPL